MCAAYVQYIEKYLIPELVSKFENETFAGGQTEHASGLDGFMSALYCLHLSTKTAEGITKRRSFFVKLMKGDENFRESSKAYAQFANEIHVYANILPAYRELLRKCPVEPFSIDDLLPQMYIAKFGYIEGLSATPKDRESVLVMENLKLQGYELGPRLYLSREQLLAMSKSLGQYHSLSYAMKLLDPPEFARLKNGITPLPFISDGDSDASKNIFRVLYRVAFDRFYEFFDRKVDGNTSDKKSDDDLRLIKALRLLREKYFAEPTRLLEEIRTDIENSEEESAFGVILHGDFNRNNVLFLRKDAQNKSSRKDDAILDIKMLDFQELRYGSPAMDISFFMYFNMSKTLREEAWMDILEKYHDSMYSTLTAIVTQRAQANEKDNYSKKLEQYSFEKFNAHFSRYAFYGVMVCMHFLPWLLCNEEECNQLSHLFETDMQGEEFRKISIEAGGDEVNFKILDIIKHACKMGYMDRIV